MNSKVIAPEPHASAIYEGGSITQIAAEELKDNIVAIRQLINSHNLVATESKNKDTEIQKAKAENEYLKTSPFVSIIAALINIIGSVLIAIGVNLLTDTSGTKPIEIIILVAGISLVIIGSLANIFYPTARKWFNK